MAVNVCMENCTEFGGYFNDMISVGTWTTSLDEALDSLEYRPWMFSLFGSVLVGLAGIFPLLVIHIEEGNDLKTGAGAETLQLLLSFAVGGLLGDVFLHLLPEAWTNSALQGEHATDHPSMNCGLWVLSGFLVFVIVEKIFAFDNESDSTTAEATTTNHAQDQSMIQKRSANATSRNKELLESENNNCLTMIGESPKNGLAKPVNLDRFSNGILDIKPLLEKRSSKNGFIKKTSNNDFKEVRRKTSKKATISTENCNGTLLASEIYSSLSKNGKTLYSTSIHKDILAETITKISVKAKSVHVTGYLNLMANCIDNFTHGLAVGGSFLVSFRLGALTTFAILVHEIPHEVGDFAILLRSGFSRWDAARAQLLTASGGIIGALTAVWCSGGGVKAQTSWILPFTAGGFLHIGMVTILPELLKESSPRESMKQLGALCFGVVLMAVLTILCD